MRFPDGYASGYSRTETLIRAKRLVAMVKGCQEQGVKSFVVSGNSGVSVAFAALVMHDFDLFLVRKDNDNSHGSTIEGPAGADMGDYAILDDRVGSGDTVRRVADKITRVHEARGVKEHTIPVCRRVCLYNDRTTTGVGKVSGNFYNGEVRSTIIPAMNSRSLQ